MLFPLLPNVLLIAGALILARVHRLAYVILPRLLAFIVLLLASAIILASVLLHIILILPRLLLTIDLLLPATVLHLV